MIDDIYIDHDGITSSY